MIACLLRVHTIKKQKFREKKEKIAREAERCNERRKDKSSCKTYYYEQ
jgi:hypothetical protein